jgi:hypothetical protein
MDEFTRVMSSAECPSRSRRMPPNSTENSARVSGKAVSMVAMNTTGDGNSQTTA